MHNKKSLYSSVFNSDYIVVGDFEPVLVFYKKISNIFGVTKQYAIKKVRDFK